MVKDNFEPVADGATTTISSAPSTTIAPETATSTPSVAPHPLPVQEALSVEFQAALNPLEEAQLRSMEARRVFEATTPIEAWMDDYFTLVEEGWSWRQAVYMLWASQPQPRTPKTQWELATQILGLASDRVIRDWRSNNPLIDTRIAQLTASALVKARADVFAALIVAATDPSYKGNRDRRLLLEMTGDYVPRQALSIGRPETRAAIEEADTETLRAVAEAGQQD
jgi:hypothetical protein